MLRQESPPQGSEPPGGARLAGLESQTGNCSSSIKGVPARALSGLRSSKALQSVLLVAAIVIVGLTLVHTSRLVRGVLIRPHSTCVPSMSFERPAEGLECKGRFADTFYLLTTTSGMRLPVRASHGHTCAGAPATCIQHCPSQTAESKRMPTLPCSNPQYAPAHVAIQCRRRLPDNSSPVAWEQQVPQQTPASAAPRPQQLQQQEEHAWNETDDAFGIDLASLKGKSRRQLGRSLAQLQIDCPAGSVYVQVSGLRLRPSQRGRVRGVA